MSKEASFFFQVIPNTYYTQARLPQIVHLANVWLNPQRSRVVLADGTVQYFRIQLDLKQIGNNNIDFIFYEILM